MTPSCAPCGQHCGNRGPANVSPGEGAGQGRGEVLAEYCGGVDGTLGWTWVTQVWAVCGAGERVCGEGAVLGWDEWRFQA